MKTTRILVVEPDDVLADELARRLARLGCTVTDRAADGKQALEAARKTRPDLVFMDNMPEGPLTGMQSAQALRKVRDVPVIFLVAEEEAAVESIDNERQIRIHTPFNDGELRMAIEFALYRHRIDAKLLSVERWLSTTLLSIGDAVIATDKNGIVSLINAAAERLTGWTEREVVGRAFNEVFRFINGDSRQPISDLIDRALMHGFSVGIDENAWLQRRDGTEIPIDDSIAPIRDEAMQVTGVVMVFRDGTQRKLALRASRATDERLEQRVQERTAQLEAANSALEAFSGSVSHDLRAPLRAVSGYSLLLSERYSKVLDGEGRRFLEIIQTKSAQMARMIDDFMRLSHLRQAPLQISLLNSNAMVREVVAGLADENPAARAIIVDPLPPFEGDRGLIQQVWVNLLGNALKFTSKREDPEIRVSADVFGGMVNFRVTDNGAGFDMAYAMRLFAPFQRLHLERDFEGNGIGLATVSRIIERHGGRIHAQGKVDHGASFVFSVPTVHRHAGIGQGSQAANDAPADETDASMEPSASSSGERQRPLPPSG